MWYATVRLHAHYLLAQLACTFAVLVLGYLVNKVWTFGAAAPAAVARPGEPAALPGRQFDPAPAVGEGEGEGEALSALENTKP
jgi:hypothetical protein